MKNIPILKFPGNYFISTFILSLFLASVCIPEPLTIVDPSISETKEDIEDNSKANNAKKNVLYNIIKLKLHNSSSTNYITFNGKKIKSSRLLNAFYIKREFKPVWFDNNKPKKIVFDLIKTIKKADLEGLDPGYYYLEDIENGLQKITENENYDIATINTKIAEIEILITNSNLQYFSDLLYGRYNLSSIFLDHIYTEPYIDLITVINKSIESKNFKESIKYLLPNSHIYHSLKDALPVYNKIKSDGGWPQIPYGAKLGKGNSSPRVINLKQRLYASGDLRLNNSESNDQYLNNEKFDFLLVDAVKNFQNRHGLLVDGVVGKNTLKALNVTIDEKINTIKLNLDFWRKLPQNLGNRYVLVNVPAFKLYGIENNQSIFEMKVIVGKLDWSTPIFSEDMTYIVVNPYWNIPSSILEDEILPELTKNPSYLSKKNIRIIGPNSSSINPQLVNWSEIDPKGWGYRLRQEPGPGNPLGRLKFMFPNTHSVYLHDTPLKKLFNRSNRKFSHGCIRVEKPLELAEFVFSGDSEWSAHRIQEEIDTGISNKHVYLQQPIPVHILYFTVWVENNDKVHFADDIYNILDSAMKQLQYDYYLSLKTNVSGLNAYHANQ